MSANKWKLPASLKAIQEKKVQVPIYDDDEQITGIEEVTFDFYYSDFDQVEIRNIYKHKCDSFDLCQAIREEFPTAYIHFI
jgi:hypothetical protein